MAYNLTPDQEGMFLIPYENGSMEMGAFIDILNASMSKINQAELVLSTSMEYLSMNTDEEVPEGMAELIDFHVGLVGDSFSRLKDRSDRFTSLTKTLKEGRKLREKIQ